MRAELELRRPCEHGERHVESGDVDRRFRPRECDEQRCGPHAGARGTPRAVRTQSQSSVISPVATHMFSSPEPYQRHVGVAISWFATKMPAPISAASSPVRRRSSDHTSTAMSANRIISIRRCEASGSNNPSQRSAATTKNTSGLL